MASINKHPSRFELTAVYHHPQAKADIVLVHGLNGAPEKTWTAPNGVYWPADLLPTSLKDQHANVLVYGYNADVYGGFWERPAKSPSDNFIHHHAQTLVTTLTHYRKSEGTERNPIIWVVHSLGGIVTKRALLYSNDLRDPNQEDLRSIYVSTYGIIFLGTPHNGSNAAAWGGIIQRMADAVVPKKIFESESVLLKSLKKDNETLQQISSHFLDIYQKFKIHMAHENQKTDVKGSKILVVDASSASPQLVGVTYYGIEATHSRMCKFESENAPGYRTVSTAIREWIADAPEVIPIRWEVEEDQRRVRANLEYFERARQYGAASLPGGNSQQAIAQNSNGITPSPVQPPPLEPGRSISAPLLTDTAHPATPPTAYSPKLLPALPESQPLPEPDHEPLFIHPETFRPNSYFIGREDELRGLHEMLMDRKRRSEGTSAVLIQCLPGGGKTHLARQYVFQHRDDYPGGVYWVRAKSRQELEYWFWRIARNEALKGLVDQRDVDELRDPRRIVHIVRRWLSAQSEWLIVFDGVQFDTPGLHEFIPDARNTSLIYTSTERAVTGDPRFDNPQVMELGLMTAQEAQDLLLLETERRRPWSVEDQAIALELVGLMGRLPLMIHVAAQHLKATREPLSRYLRSYRNRPKAGNLPAYKVVREQLENRGENEALNLMSLLVFFDQHVPVEMLALGISALDKVTPVKSCDATHRKASLNNTLKVLIAFALLERSESDDISPTSSRSSKRSFDRHVDYLDLLRIHSVVQAFFIDSLDEQHQIPFWLERAVAVWARSYDDADRRIQEDPRVGLPDDYRRFCIHGEKLLKNLTRFEKRYPKLAVAKSHLEQRLGRIQGQIDDLSHTIQKNILDGSGEEYPASVFDRISSSSQSDAATMQSHSSQLSRVGSLGDGDVDLVQSPVTELLEQDAQMLVPYPTTPGVMPMVPEITEDDDQETVVLSVAGTQVHVGATDPVDTSSLPPDPYDRQHDAAYFDDWQSSIPHHRVLKRQETRRYHDRAGSWRAMTVSDPRVGLSWEVALGSILSRRDASPSSSGAHLTAQSEAEMQLNKIKKAAPPSPRQRGSFGSQSMARPMTLVGRNSWAVPQAQKTPDTDVAQIHPEEFSSGLTQILSSPKSWTEATIKMLKKTVMPSDKPNKSPPRPQKPQTPPEEELIVPPSGIFRGSRSANSSPASHSSPFPPPSLSGIPTDELFSKAGVPIVVRRWDTVVYHPDGTPISSSGIEWSSASDPLSHSFPTLPPSRHHHPGNINTAQLLLHGSNGGPPAGYSSQPMSRDGSHQSNPSINIHSPTAAIHSARSSSPSPSPTGTDPAQRASPPGYATSAMATGGSPTGSRPIPTPSSRLAPFPFARGRRPSYTETEPSPRMDTPFPDVDTSYRHWADQHNHSHHQPDYHNPPPLPLTAGTSFPPPTSSTIPRTRPITNPFRLRTGRRAARILPTRGAAARRAQQQHQQQQQPRDGRSRRAHSLSPSAGAGPPAGSTGSPVPWPPASPSTTSSPLSASGPASLSSSLRGRALAQARDVAGAGAGLGLGIGQQQQHLSPLAEWAVPPQETETGAATGTGVGTGVVLGEVVPMGGEDMARSGSAGSHSYSHSRSRSGSGADAGIGGVAAAGIRMEDGTVVEFGAPALGSASGSSPGLGLPGPGRGGGGGGGGGKKPRRGSFPGMGPNGFVVFD
ncbi:hypothetical protein CHGG_09738 [Chaetomium globosum CBS 148.51]|uniref:DUF676 domain-containing protein n=1 Tax=Chaetomium globosum (strain ATCC 6205 / CBS 148.51 / DSM 1962 / NBRC 6347 / NRRL 1970) TaxID=306901 RepID=Q2GQL6_CHAGB|nr:uncharacterized protein CHGG_09738 [Chaetomium globosum CBS 148.51]EAQ83334.1 hypothetical protein CHGG_09738 [Chaetomium globosum CBS 148.51]